MAVNSCCKKEYFVKLNLGIGFMKFRNQFLHFDNYVSADQVTKSSCNTIYRNNKKEMTDLREKGDESLHDIISRVASFRTQTTRHSQNSKIFSLIP